MEYRKFGNTDLKVSAVGFGAWGIGGAAMAGSIPIGWGQVDARTSIDALKKAMDQGINFFDTADFYGLGVSETLIGKTLGSNKEMIIASKVGHRLDDQQKIFVDYSKAYIFEACEESLKRLKRDHIDFYQLHTAKASHLQQGECIEAMETLKTQGKIRYWGLSLNTYKPAEEANFMLENQLGDGLQLVFNIINQRALGVFRKAAKAGYGVIARMPLQFGLLTGKFNKNTTFDKDDHRSFRLTPEILKFAHDQLIPVWPLTEQYGISKTTLSLSYILSYPEISTVIPGIKSPEQVVANTEGIIKLKSSDLEWLEQMFNQSLYRVVDMMENAG